MRGYMQFIIEPFRKQDVLFLVLAALLVAIYVGTAGGGFPLDDSWIHQTYGRNLAEYGEWAFIPSIPSAASTSPLYTVILAAGYKLGVHYFFWAHLWGVIALTLAGIVGSRMAERLLPKQKHIGLIAGLVLVIAWHHVWAAASGMETMLFSTLTLVLIGFSWRELDERSSHFQAVILRGGAFGILAALTTLARPEGVMLAGLIGLAMLIARPQGWRNLFIYGAGSAIGFGLVISPYLLLNLQITGGLLPDTAAAKYADMLIVLTTLTYFQRFQLMITPLLAGGQLFLLPGMLYFIIRLWHGTDSLREKVLFSLPFAWGLALIGLYAARLPAPFQHGRYVIPALPALILTGVVGTAQLLPVGGFSTLQMRVLKKSFLLASGIFFLVLALFNGPPIYRRDVRIIEEEMVASAHWVKENISEDEVFASHDIGALGYFVQRPVIDVAGLVTPEIVPILHDKEAVYAFLQERDARYLMAFPDQVPGRKFDDSNDPRLCPIHESGGTTSNSVGGPKMVVYRLAWDRLCPEENSN
jgi:hypothetical protein